jgi:hypothetical protein
MGWQAVDAVVFGAAAVVGLDSLVGWLEVVLR